MKIIDLIHKTDENKILEAIALHYGSDEIEQFKNLIKNLRLITPDRNEINTTIFIKVYEESETDDIIRENFDETDTSLYFDVSAYNDSDDTIYSIAGASYSEFLNYTVEPDTLNKMSYQYILAHCLFEVTAYTFNKQKNTQC